MCGILAVVNSGKVSSKNLIEATQIISHRGPDDEGYLLWSAENGIKLLVGSESKESTRLAYNYERISPDESGWQVGFGHRRLSIIDLSPAGHQPMVLMQAGLAITYNGEIYNYLELREELKSMGCVFHTHSDTEVILHAWSTWREMALHKFNGMFAFVLLDTKKKKLYAVRDRFGVKPLYYTDQPGYVAFASEVKQLRVLPAYKFGLNARIAYNYLQHSLIDHEEETFENEIFQVQPGNLIECDLSTNSWTKRQWYELVPTLWTGTEQEACEKLTFLLKDSVRLRMRSDVPVGSALSGGLDSSIIVCLMRQLLDDQSLHDHLIKTITSCSVDKKYDEWAYAEQIIKKVNAESHTVFPSFEKLQKDLEKMLWHMDYPFGSTSQFSQWCVFEGAAHNGLKVMIDGQGADEQFAGYGGNDMALYVGLLGSMDLFNLFKEIGAYKKYKGQWPTGFVIGAVQHHLPKFLNNLLPDRFLVNKQNPKPWLMPGKNHQVYDWPESLRASLLRQVTRMPLPSLLRYEDRNSMAFSIESRVPFMDYRLMEFSLGLPERYVYYKGERKAIMRKTFRGMVPDEILNRKDKMGFVSAEERWIKEEGKSWFEKELNSLELLNDLVDPTTARQSLNNIVSGKTPFNFDLWRIINLSLFLKQRLR